MVSIWIGCHVLKHTKDLKTVVVVVIYKTPQTKNETFLLDCLFRDKVMLNCFMYVLCRSWVMTSAKKKSRLSIIFLLRHQRTNCTMAACMRVLFRQILEPDRTDKFNNGSKTCRKLWQVISKNKMSEKQFATIFLQQSAPAQNEVNIILG